ncbi:MAG: putative CoA-binding protein [Halioglobus sp.]|jgi:predicted CoA-binding protein
MRELLIRRFLLSHGYTVIPVNPALNGTQLLGQRVYISPSDTLCHVDMVDVFRNAVHLPATEWAWLKRIDLL